MRKISLYAFSILSVMLLVSPEVYAATNGEAVSGLALGAGLGIGLAAAGGAIGQGKTMDAACTIYIDILCPNKLHTYGIMVHTRKIKNRD